LVFGVSGRIFTVRIEKHADRVEGEQVARQANCNRESTRMEANLGKRDQPAKRAALMLFRPLGRCGVRLAPRSGKRGTIGDVFGETPNTAVGATALPTDRISKYSRLFESIRGSMRPSVEVQKQLMQVVDFHDNCGYFHMPLIENPANHRHPLSCIQRRFSAFSLL
jgi:hypothetical protein